jgi:Leucine-rich repeat (LRR) protein
MLTYLSCANNQLSSLPNLPYNLVELICANNPYNLWKDLININTINLDMFEIICEKLSVFNAQIQELQDNLNKNICDKYNEIMAQLKKDVQEVLNEKYEINL